MFGIIQSKRRAGGFSLLELLAVLVILGILAGIFAPRFLGQAESAKRKAAVGPTESINSKPSSAGI